MKIIITGGLGYIGTELCKLYSGYSHLYKVIVIDNRFISAHVKQLKDWNIDFVHGSILDEDLLKKILVDSDIIYHLAGITDVAYIKTESNLEKDSLIKEVGKLGTLNILKYAQNAKIIFPSTHVVFEGLKETKLFLSEDFPTCPVLTYSKVKDCNELDIKSLNNNYIILRLGSVYGYSTDTMRINIMPNLFSKISSQNGTIKLFSGGVQHKSLVNVIDVARCMKFFGESTIKNETYHVVRENTTIKNVAEICKKINSNVKIIETNDEIPNLGYTLSNQKLLNTGFKFLYNLEDSIREMINNWKFSTQESFNEKIVQGGDEFIDDRGKISNYELTESINLIGYIESKAFTVRANHYHPIQEQKCLLIKGKYISVTKDLLKENSELEFKTIMPGDLSIIPPNVAHAMLFLEDSIFLNLVNGERKHQNYGITHTIPYIVLDEKLQGYLTM